MRLLTPDLKQLWLYMLVPPWRRTESVETRINHWAGWLAGWAWVLAGLILGALVASPLLQFTGLANTSYDDWLIIGIAIFVGFVLQVVGWFVALFAFAILRSIFFLLFMLMSLFVAVFKSQILSGISRPSFIVSLLATIGAALLPLVGVGYGIYRYLTWVGAGQREITIAFVGALLIKTFAIPLIKGVVTGALFSWFMKWLRGGKDTKKAD